MLEAINICKSYNNVEIITDINLGINRGEILGLLGPNGAGKTTFIRVINQIIAPDKGIVKINDRAIRFADQIHFGYLPEERGLYKKLTVEENLAFFGQLKDMPKSEVKNRTKELASLLEFKDFISKKIEDCSKGMQQKIQFAASIIHNPDIVILDEPLSGLDPINADVFVSQIERLKLEGKAIMLVTHRMDSVEDLCQSMALINKGKLIYSGRVNEAKRKYSTETITITVKEKTPLSYDGLEIEFINEVYNGFTFSVFYENQRELALQLIRQLQESDSLVAFTPKEISMQEIFKKLVSGNETN